MTRALILVIALVGSACAGAENVARMSPPAEGAAEVEPRPDPTSGGTSSADRGSGRMVHRRIRYAERSGEQLGLDVYRIPGVTMEPVVVVMHGGLWSRRVKEMWLRYVPRMVRAGYVVVMPDVRLSPPGGSSTFPAPVRDLSSSIAWLRQHAWDIGGDPRRIALVGSSSGAHLALLAAGTGGGRPDAVVAYSPPIDLADLHERNITRRGIENHLGCIPAGCPATFEQASPVTAVDRRTPPAMVIYSRDEVMPLEHGRALRDRFRSVGVEHEMVEVPGKIHGLKLAPRVLPLTLRFIERHLAAMG